MTWHCSTFRHNYGRGWLKNVNNNGMAQQNDGATREYISNIEMTDRKHRKKKRMVCSTQRCTPLLMLLTSQKYVFATVLWIQWGLNWSVMWINSLSAVFLRAELFSSQWASSLTQWVCLHTFLHHLLSCYSISHPGLCTSKVVQHQAH